MKTGLLDNVSRCFIGDGVIHRGLTTVIAPGLAVEGVGLKVPGPWPDARPEMDARLRTVGYVVKPGTPSWYRDYDEHCWHEAIRLGLRCAFLGIGTGNPDTVVPWELYMPDGRELRDAIQVLVKNDTVDVVVTRDVFTAWHWTEFFGFPRDRVLTLPCPGFFGFGDPEEPRASKRIVGLDVADDRRCSRSRDATFGYYYERLHRVRRLLEMRGCEVRVQTHERDAEYLRCHGFDVTQFGSREEMESYYRGIDVYVGAKVHGALPCAGIGKPAILLGVDGRHSAAWQIPEIKTINIEAGHWHPAEVAAWWDELDPAAVSEALIARRARSLAAWRTVIRERTPLGWAVQACRYPTGAEPADG